MVLKQNLVSDREDGMIFAPHYRLKSGNKAISATVLGLISNDVDVRGFLWPVSECFTPNRVYLVSQLLIHRSLLEGI